MTVLLARLSTPRASSMLTLSVRVGYSPLAGPERGGRLSKRGKFRRRDGNAGFRQRNHTLLSAATMPSSFFSGVGGSAR